MIPEGQFDTPRNTPTQKTLHGALLLCDSFTKCFNPSLFFRLRDPDQQILEDLVKHKYSIFINTLYSRYTAEPKWHFVIKYKYLDFSTSSVTCRSIMLVTIMQLYTSVGWQRCSQSPSTTMCCNIKLCCCECCRADLCTLFYSSALLCLALWLLSVHCWFFNTFVGFRSLSSHIHSVTKLLVCMKRIHQGPLEVRWTNKFSLSFDFFSLDSFRSIRGTN